MNINKPTEYHSTTYYILSKISQNKALYLSSLYFCGEPLCSRLIVYCGDVAEDPICIVSRISIHH